MIKVIKRKKLFEGEATAQPAANAAAPAQPAALPTNNEQAVLPVNADAAAQAINNFVAGVANSIKGQCTQENLGKAIPQLIEAGKNEQLKPALEPINKAMNAIAGMEVKPEDPATSQNVIKGYGDLLTAFASFTKALADAAQAPQQNLQTQLPAAPATQPTTQLPAAPAQ